MVTEPNKSYCTDDKSPTYLVAVLASPPWVAAVSKGGWGCSH